MIQLFFLSFHKRVFGVTIDLVSSFASRAFQMSTLLQSSV